MPRHKSEQSMGPKWRFQMNYQTLHGILLASTAQHCNHCYRPMAQRKTDGTLSLLNWSYCGLNYAKPSRWSSLFDIIYRNRTLWQLLVASWAFMWVYPCTVYPKKYAHGFVVLCFVVVMQLFIMNSHEVFIHIHQGCFAGTGAIVRLPQCQWSKPDGYGKISQCITTTKHSKAKTVCIFLGIYCIQCWNSWRFCWISYELLWEGEWEVTQFHLMHRRSCFRSNIIRGDFCTMKQRSTQLAWRK